MKLPSVLGAVPNSVQSKSNMQPQALLTRESSAPLRHHSLKTSQGPSYEEYVLTTNKATQVHMCKQDSDTLVAFNLFFTFGATCKFSIYSLQNIL